MKDYKKTGCIFGIMQMILITGNKAVDTHLISLEQKLHTLRFKTSKYSFGR